MAPTFAVGGATAFGVIPGKGTTIFGQATPVQRNFQGQIRLSFEAFSKTALLKRSLRR